MSLHGSTPIFRIFDETKAREFYLDFLGFEVVFEHRFDPDAPLYLGIARDACSLHLTEHHGDCSPGASARVAVSDLVDYHRELSDKDYSYNRPVIEDQPWGSRDMTVTDPFGNRLTFTEAISDPA